MKGDLWREGLLWLAMAIYSTTLLKLYLDLFLPKAGIKKTVIGWLPFFVWQLLSETGRFQSGMTLALTFVTILCVGLAGYRGNRWKQCAFPTVYLVLWMLSEGAADFGIKWISNSSVTGFRGISTVSKGILLLLVVGIRRFVKQSGMGMEPCSGGLWELIMPVMGMLLYHSLYQALADTGQGRSETVLWMLVAAVSMMVLHLSFYPFYGLVEKNLYRKKNEKYYQKQMELFRQEQAMEQAAASEIREFRHDMRQRLIYLEGLLRDKEFDKAMEALSELTGEAFSKGRLESRTGNLVVDSLINHAWSRAESQGILFHTEIGNLPELSAEDRDLCILLGNALDNALEASGMMPGRGEIWIAIHYEKGCLSIQVKNRYEGELKTGRDGQFLSRKEGKGHGFGLPSMRKTAERCGGSLAVKPENGIFCLQITLYC